jgi:hypothetical protein
MMLFVITNPLDGPGLFTVTYADTALPLCITVL